MSVYIRVGTKNRHERKATYRWSVLRARRAPSDSRAFDAAWAEIAGNFGNDPAEIETARLKLAKAMLSIADDDSRDVAALKQAALERMALDYRS
jgi:hypothetical protein